jgi:hypothetical protein
MLLGIDGNYSGVRDERPMQHGKYISRAEDDKMGWGLNMESSISL